MERKTLPMLLAEANEIACLIADAGGELTLEIEAKLDQSNLDIGNKADAYGMVMMRIESQIEAAERRIGEWKSYLTAQENGLKRIKDRLLFGMTSLEMTEITGHEMQFKIQANPPSVIIDDPAQIPGMFIVTETPPPVTKILKKEIAQAFKDGMNVAGAHIERSTRLVRKVGVTKAIK